MEGLFSSLFYLAILSTIITALIIIPKETRKRRRKYLIASVVVVVISFVGYNAVIQDDPVAEAEEAPIEEEDGNEGAINDEVESEDDNEDTGEDNSQDENSEGGNNDGNIYGEDRDDSGMYEALIKKQVAEYADTSINEICVNSNGEDDGDHGYYAQVFLLWDVQNGAKTTRDMAKMYSGDLAASFKYFDDLLGLTVFWEIPYHLKGDNIAKYTFERNDDGMYFAEEWYAPIIR